MSQTVDSVDLPDIFAFAELQLTRLLSPSSLFPAEVSCHILTGQQCQVLCDSDPWCRDSLLSALEQSGAVNHVLPTDQHELLRGIESLFRGRLPLAASGLDRVTLQVALERLGFLGSVTEQTIHGNLLQIDGIGVLIIGKSDVGKSEISLELIRRGHALIADDAPEVSRNRMNGLVGRCPDLLAGMMEVRSLGVLDVSLLFGSEAVSAASGIDLVVLLLAPEDKKTVPHCRLRGSCGTTSIANVPLPLLELTPSSRADAATVIEVAAKQAGLMQQGKWVLQEFQRRLASTIGSGG